VANTVMKCPACGYKESILSSRPSAQDPPCPRCEKFVRMVIVPPPIDGQTTWSTGGSKGQ